MILNLLWHLLDTPSALAEVRADPDLLPAAVEESLRLEPAAAVVDRYATRDIELGGASIRRGDPVTVSHCQPARPALRYGANRDPAEFPDPDTFDLHRPNLRQQLAFATGPHVCPAADLARLETVIGVRTLLATLPGLVLDQPAPPVGLVFRKPPALHVRWGHA